MSNIRKIKQLSLKTIKSLIKKEKQLADEVSELKLKQEKGELSLDEHTNLMTKEAYRMEVASKLALQDISLEN